MSENKKRVSVWVPTVILGVVAILFAFYALQLGTELRDAKKQTAAAIERAETAEKMAMQQLRVSREQMAQAQQDRERSQKELEECQKSSKKK